MLTVPDCFKYCAAEDTICVFMESNTSFPHHGAEKK
jgi:hypothetical protein